jgi:signal peptidase I
MQMSGSSQKTHSFITTNKGKQMTSTKTVPTATIRSTIAFASISIFLMVAPALATAYFGLGIFTVMSESMKPYMAAGDEIVTDVVSAHDVQIGDVILFVNPENLEQIAHRVVKTSTTDNLHYVITTKGDANPAVDTPALTFNTNASIRRVITVVPKIGFVLDVVSSTATKTGGSIALIGYLIYLIRKTRRKVESSNSTISGALTDAEITARVENLVKEHLSSTATTFVPANSTSPTQNQNNRADIYL